MKVAEIRQAFIAFFEKRGHRSVQAAPLVHEDDHTLLFTNAGMNQFKNYFVGHASPPHQRMVGIQPCLRVSGKHNDLEEVGFDNYHHTFFEMLGNWSFGLANGKGGYGKAQAVQWAFAHLVELGVPAADMYVSYFNGDKKNERSWTRAPSEDREVVRAWEECTHKGQSVDKTHILGFGAKDNFWEMGKTGPCGRCTEIHVDLRSTQEKKAIPGRNLVNKGHPAVIELWNLVFIEYEQRGNGSLLDLPTQHVDTGMGLERIAMVLQGKQSTYDTDLFRPFIEAIEGMTGVRYGTDDNKDVAFRVIADHLRAIAAPLTERVRFSNVGAGYVLRRMLRRAMRYGYQRLALQEPFLYKLTDIWEKEYGTTLASEQVQVAYNLSKGEISNLVKKEEEQFLLTLAKGLRRLQVAMRALPKGSKLSGDTAFTLYDTYGFPLDLTRIILKEKGFGIDEAHYAQQLMAQKERSRAVEDMVAEPWIVKSVFGLRQMKNTQFVGYKDQGSTLLKEQEGGCRLLGYRAVKKGDKIYYQVLLEKTSFYPEGGGQIGDTGTLKAGHITIKIVDTRKEGDLIVHYTHEIPTEIINHRPSPLPERASIPDGDFSFVPMVDEARRTKISSNHTATHLLHTALRNALGKHVAQRGSRVTDEGLRFDFSHPTRLREEEITRMEALVRKKIAEAIPCKIETMSYKEAQKKGATALFGEKYGEHVRVVSFGESVELCGGTHVKNTQDIRFFKIVSERATAAGIRRIHAITGSEAEKYVNKKTATEQKEATAVRNFIMGSKWPSKQDTALTRAQKFVQACRLLEEALLQHFVLLAKEEMKRKMKRQRQDVYVVVGRMEESTTLKNLLSIFCDTKKPKEVLKPDIGLLRQACYALKAQVEAEKFTIFIVLMCAMADKVFGVAMCSQALVKDYSVSAKALCEAMAPAISGGSGGQDFIATVGGKNKEGIQAALTIANTYVDKHIPPPLPPAS